MLIATQVGSTHWFYFFILWWTPYVLINVFATQERISGRSAAGCRSGALPFVVTLKGGTKGAAATAEEARDEVHARRSISEEMDWGDVTPEEARAGMAAWDEYTAELRDAGAFVAGEGLQPSADGDDDPRSTADERITVDGPFAETKEQLGGFYLIECADLDEALDWARKIPARRGSAIEVRPVMDYEATGGSTEHTPRRRSRRSGPTPRRSTACSGASRDGRSRR